MNKTGKTTFKIVVELSAEELENVATDGLDYFPNISNRFISACMQQLTRNWIDETEANK